MGRGLDGVPAIYLGEAGVRAASCAGLWPNLLTCAQHDGGGAQRGHSPETSLVAEGRPNGTSVDVMTVTRFVCRAAHARHAGQTGTRSQSRGLRQGGGRMRRIIMALELHHRA